MSLIWLLIIVCVLLAMCGGAWGWGTFGGLGLGYDGWSGMGLLAIVLIVAILWLAGALR